MARDSDQEGGNPIPGAGRRPLGKEGAVRSFDTKPKGEFDPKGKKIFDGYAPGQSFKKRSGAELVGAIKQASQDAPEALEQQRIPKAAREMAKGYFRNLRDRNSNDAKTDSKP